jgi:hypothetical protein
MLPTVEAVPKVRDTAIGELTLPMFTALNIVLVAGGADSTVKLIATVGAAANTFPSPDWFA